MEKLDYSLITKCLINRQGDLKEYIEFYKMNCERFELDLDTYKDRISAYENEITRIEEELNKIKQIRINLYCQN